MPSSSSGPPKLRGRLGAAPWPARWCPASVRCRRRWRSPRSPARGQRQDLLRRWCENSACAICCVERMAELPRRSPRCRHCGPHLGVERVQVVGLPAAAVVPHHQRVALCRRLLGLAHRTKSSSVCGSPESTSPSSSGASPTPSRCRITRGTPGVLMLHERGHPHLVGGAHLPHLGQVLHGERGQVVEARQVDHERPGRGHVLSSESGSILRRRSGPRSRRNLRVVPRQNRWEIPRRNPARSLSMDV